MARQLRAMLVAHICHVTARGNNKQCIVWDDVDRAIFMRRLDETSKRHRWIGLAYCLMTNHYHLVVRLPEGGLSEGIRELNSGFARVMNRRHGRIGHLFQQRFHSEPVLGDRHLREACRYVPLNPVRAGLCNRPDEYRWSSHRALGGYDFASPFLHVDEALRYFGRDLQTARARYVRFVSEGRVPVSDTGGARLRP